ncbi:AMP-binding protein [Nocardia sp. CA-128927]|uniref:AMP-binding protein n=1 Tax=Nocardia sp. CA-128927 TaxID=3239975 RepID=UPI003D982C96
MTMRVASAVATAADAFADRAAISDGDCLHDYASVWEAMECFGAGLTEARVRPGTRVGIYVGSGYEALLAMLAVEQIGAVAAPLDICDPPELTRRKIAEIGIGHLIGHRRDEHILTEVVDEIDALGPTMVSVAGDYTLARLASGRTEPDGRDGFAFCLPDGAGALEVGSSVLTAAALEMRDDIDATVSDVVAVTEPLTTRVVLTSVLATLLAGACLSVRRCGGANPAWIAEQLHSDEASILLCSNDRLMALRGAGVRTTGPLRVLELTEERACVRAYDGLGGRYRAEPLPESADRVRYGTHSGAYPCRG